MSGFEDNPFGEPLVDNPFADPAIQQVTRNTQNAQNSLEDYNPFEQETAKPQIQVNSANSVAVVQPSSQNIPPSTSARNANEELQRRQEELDRKAAELDRREQQLLQGNVPQLNNWPPLPDKCCFQPCFYQDINLDIPSEFQRIVRHLYYAWTLYTFTMCANVIGGLIILLHTGSFTNFGLAIFYTVLFSPASYVCWFRPAYKAFRNDSSFNFMVFFFVYFAQTLLTVFQTIGVPSSGYCGFFVAITMFDSTPSGIIVGLLLLMVAIGFATCAGANVLLITKVHSIYRSSGASMAKAQAEFTTGFMRNQNVQDAASNVMSAAVSSQLNSNNTNSSRY